MAPNRRDMYDELREGASDGAVKKRRPDTSNASPEGDLATESARDMLQTAVNAWDRTYAGEGGNRRYTSGLVRGS